MSQPSNRREFIQQAALSAAGLAALGAGCCHTSGGAKTKALPVAFNTANLVARLTGYRFELKNWGEQHQKTVAGTDARAWETICREIAAAGFRAVEVWEAHAAPETMNRERTGDWRRIMEDHGLKPVAYAGHLEPKTIEISQWLGIPQIAGSMGSLTPKQATDLCRTAGFHFNHENHPEKSVAEILGRIEGGNEWIGVCVDTGWLGTQGVSAPQAIRALGPLVRHTHIKDVKAVGGHATCALGEGVVDVAGTMRALREIGYKGWYSWEDEPEDRNPFDSAVRNRKWIESQLLAGGN